MRVSKKVQYCEQIAIYAMAKISHFATCVIQDFFQFSYEKHLFKKIIINKVRFLIIQGVFEVSLPILTGNNLY